MSAIMETKSRHGGADRISAKAKLARELALLGALLAEVRELHGLRQAEVAARLGLPASYLSKIENGSRRVDPVELIRIAAAIGVDPGQVLNDLRDRLASLD